MWSRFTSHLYVRIWLAVVLTVAVLTLSVGWAWRMSADVQLPIREIVIRNEAGQVIGSAQTSADRRRGQDLSFDVVTHDGQTLEVHMPRPQRPPGSNPWLRPPFGFFWTLALVGLAVALAAYPIIRRLTLRLEALQRGVERWGSGDLSTRVTVQGQDEVAFLAERFNSAAERIETLMDSQKALLNAHKNLLANASHELRSPLTRIRMGLELMSADITSPQRIEISRSITELDQLIDEILLASRLDTKQADAEPFETLDLTGLAAEECSRVKAELTAELGHQADTDNAHSLQLRGSTRLLRRLLRNLLENAKRYSDGDVTLVLSQGGSTAQPTAVIRVNDHGPGVPAEQRERIFEPFYRLPGASERDGGVGLGLALVKSIAERHDGTVRCEDNPGGGASFVVELPIQLNGAG
ncbi:MAG: two-component system OmpR family sensor kinase [Polaromonas sp.]|jgi:two-component system OmpR family sensor kinase